MKRLSKRANQRIVRLEREFGKNTWATRYLKEKLEVEPLQAWTKSGRIRVNKSMTITQLDATIKATKEFLSSKISTKRGIKKSREIAIKALQRKYGTETRNIEYEEAETLINFFNDDTVNDITNYIEGSDVLPIIEEAREKQNDYMTFVSQMEAVQKYNKGKSFENILRKIYIKYVYKGKNDNEVDILYSNFIGLINSATSEEESQEIENMINNLLSKKKINEQEYNYLINLLEDKRKEF